MIDKKEIEALANRLCEGFFKRQSANLLTNVEKKNVEKLDVTRDRILSAIGEELNNPTVELAKKCVVVDSIFPHELRNFLKLLC